MRHLPLLGRELPESAIFTCGYTPGHPDGYTICARDALFHGVVLDDPVQKIIAMMWCCDEHLHRMKLTADYVHEVKHPCGIPGSQFRWPENYCFTDWDEQAEFAEADSLLMAGVS